MKKPESSAFFDAETIWSSTYHCCASVLEICYFPNSLVPAALNSRVVFASFKSFLSARHRWLIFLFMSKFRLEYIKNTLDRGYLFSLSQKTSINAQRKRDIWSTSSESDASSIPIMPSLLKRPHELCVLSAFEKYNWRSNPAGCLPTSLWNLSGSEGKILLILLNALGSRFDLRMAIVVSLSLLNVFTKHTFQSLLPPRESTDRGSILKKAYKLPEKWTPTIGNLWRTGGTSRIKRFRADSISVYVKEFPCFSKSVQFWNAFVVPRWLKKETYRVWLYITNMKLVFLCGVSVQVVPVFPEYLNRLLRSSIAVEISFLF